MNILTKINGRLGGNFFWPTPYSATDAAVRGDMNIIVMATRIELFAQSGRFYTDCRLFLFCRAGAGV